MHKLLEKSTNFWQQDDCSTFHWQEALAAHFTCNWFEHYFDFGLKIVDKTFQNVLIFRFCLLEFDFIDNYGKNQFCYNVKVDIFICNSNWTIKLRQLLTYLFISSTYCISFHFFMRLKNPWTKDKALIQ